MRVGEKSSWIFLTILVAILGIGLLSLAFRNSTVVFDSPLTEDGYYVLTVARNLARGVGFSVDGTTWTNGFHPLWAILSSLAFVLAGDASEPAIRILLAASAVFSILSALSWSSVVGGAFDANSRLYRIIFMLVYLTSFQLLAQHFNGLETGFSLLLFAVIGNYWCGSYDYHTRGSAVLGLLLGILFLARIDAAIFGVLVATEAVWRLRSDFRKAFVQSATMGAVASLIAAPWFIYNLALTGKLVPVSGLALGLETDRPLDRMVNAAGAIARDGFPSILGEINRPVSLAVFLLACAVALFLFYRQSTDSLPGPRDISTGTERFTRRCREYTAMILCYVAVQIAVYTLSNGATFFYPRYFILLSVLAVGVFAFLLYRLALSRMTWLAVTAAVLLTVGALTTVAGWHGVSFAQRLNQLQSYVAAPCLDQVALAKAFRMTGEKVGALQTGTLAFFVEGAINLDGKVNFAAYEARRRGKLLDYILEQRIGLLVDFDLYLQPGHFGYFPANEDTRRYFSQIAPDHVAKEYEWVALRRPLGMTVR
jgi:hypothetical protein